MPKDNEVDEKVTPVAWAMTDYQSDGPNTQFTRDPYAAEYHAGAGIDVEPLYSAATVAELRAEVERLRGINSSLVDKCNRLNLCGAQSDQRADAAERRVGECLKFIDGIRDELHNRRTADWYPEGAHNAAAQMSEDMRLLGNACADFDPYTLTGADPT